MNTFTIDNDRMGEFEEVWTNRERHLDEMKGFISFKLLKGDKYQEENKRDYISHSVWESYDDFMAWTKSDQFIKAHQNSKTPKGIILGPPRFRGYEVILNENNSN